MLVCKGDSVFKVSMVQREHGEGDVEMWPEEQQPAHMGRWHRAGLKLRPNSKATRKPLEDFKQEKLLDVLEVSPMAAAWRVDWRRRGQELGAQ